MIDETNIRQQAVQEWRTQPALRAEFTSADALVAYRLATARGLVRVLPASVVHATAETVRAAAAAAGGAFKPLPASPAKLTLRSAGARLQIGNRVNMGTAAPGLPARFTGIAYSGGFVPSYGVVIDLASVTFKPRMPLLNAHGTGHTDVVGAVEKMTVGRSGLAVEGVLYSDVPDSPAERIAQLAARGAPFELSVGVYHFVREEVAAGQSIMVNGRRFDGPLGVLRQGFVREVSAVVLGADSATEVSFA